MKTKPRDIGTSAETAATCAAPDCSRASRARGYCDTHYRRVRKWGDPTVVLRPWGTDHLQRSS
jgi:hypothetical protein